MPQQVDYDKLAAAHGGIDYDAIAAQIGGTSAPPAAPEHERTYLDTATDLAKGAIAGVASTIYGGGDLIRRATGMQRIINDPDVKAAMTPPSSTAGRIGYGGEQLGEFFLPTGVVGKGAKLAEVVKAGALTAAQTQGDPTATALSAGITAIPGGAIAEKLSGALKSSALETMAGSLKATKEWAKAQSEKLAPEMLKRGVGGSIKALRAQASEMAAKVGANLEDAYKTAAAAGETVPGDIVRGNLQLASDALHERGASGLKIPIPGHEHAIAHLAKLDEFVQQMGPDIPVDKAAGIKQAWDAIVSKAGLYGQNVMAPASEKAEAWGFREAANSFRQLLNTNPTIADLNKEASFWIGLRDVVNATKLRRVGQVGGLIPQIAGTTGAIAGASMAGPIGAGAGAYVGNKLARVLQSPAFMSKVSAPLKNKLADALASGSYGRISSVTSQILASLPAAQLRPSVAP